MNKEIYSYNAGVFIDENIQVVNKKLIRKLYLYDNFYEDTDRIVSLFNLDSENCKNKYINDFKNVFEHILSKPINTLKSNVIKLTNDYIINPDNSEWIAVVFLNPNIPIGNGLAFLQENFNSNNKITCSDTDYTQLIIEDFFYGKPNRIIIFNSKYYHKLVVKTPILVEIIHVKML